MVLKRSTTPVEIMGAAHGVEITDYIRISKDYKRVNKRSRSGKLMSFWGNWLKSDEEKE